MVIGPVADLHHLRAGREVLDAVELPGPDSFDLHNESPRNSHTDMVAAGLHRRHPNRGSGWIVSSGRGAKLLGRP